VNPSSQASLESLGLIFGGILYLEAYYLVVKGYATKSLTTLIIHAWGIFWIYDFTLKHCSIAIIIIAHGHSCIPVILHQLKTHLIDI
jgi:hypothetical protein